MAQTTISAPQQQVAMPAVDLRQAIGALVSTEGVRAATDLAVAQRGAGANMSVDVAAGSAVIQDDHGSGGGFYSYTLAATTNVAVTGSDPTNPRIDRVVIRVRDQALGDAANDAAPVVVAGTPTSGATLVNLTGAAAVPGSSLLLANILVPATSTSVTTANIDTTVRVVAAGGIYRDYTPIRTAGGTDPGIGNGTSTGRYCQVGKLVHYFGQFVFGSSTPASTGLYAISLPVNRSGVGNAIARVHGIIELTDSSAGAQAFAVADTAASVSVFQMFYAATYLGVRTNVGGAAPWAWATGDFIAWNLIYEAA